MIGGDRSAPRWKIGRKVSQGEVCGSPRGCKTTIREEKEGMRLLNILGADCRVSSFIYVLPPRFYYVSWKFFARIYPSLELLFARDVATILRINECSLLSRREETFFCIFSLSIILLEDTTIERLLFSFRNSLFFFIRVYPRLKAVSCIAICRMQLSRATTRSYIYVYTLYYVQMRSISIKSKRI